MALDRELVGRSYPPSAVYEVGRAKIAEFATAIGEDDPVHRDADAARAAGHPDVIAPPTFAITVTLAAAMIVLDDPDVAIDYSRVVHGEQRFTHHRPIRAGDRLIATTTIDAARALGHPDVIAPPTFAIAVSLEAAMVVLDDPDVALDYSRVVHGEQKFVHHRPIRAGDRLVATTTIDAARTVAGNDLLTARVDLATEDGEAVCTSTSMLVARGDDA